MGYRGYEEVICVNGHYFREDAMLSICQHPESMFQTQICPHCKAKLDVFHSVDETNGYDEGHHQTSDAPKELIGFHDIPKEDHRGNKYFDKIDIYKPIGESWIKFIDD